MEEAVVVGDSVETAAALAERVAAMVMVMVPVEVAASAGAVAEAEAEPEFALVRVLQEGEAERVPTVSEEAGDVARALPRPMGVWATGVAVEKMVARAATGAMVAAAG